LARDRRSGILLHPTSLPGPHGTGDLGGTAHRFAGWLADAGQRLWQVLPLGPTGFGDSPYQALSGRAGNPLLVSLEVLRNEGWLSDGDLAAPPAGDGTSAELDAALAWKRARLARAAAAFARSAAAEARADLEAFRAREASWLREWSLFAVLKGIHGGRPWTDWEPALGLRAPDALEAARARHAEAIFAEEFAQWCFFRQWEALRARCRALGIALMGDVPIYVAHDSVEVWSRPDLFRLDARGAPLAVAGVPPDYFSANGQLWGNPLYRWDAIAREGWAFWIERMRGALALVDRVRLDHFRGFEAFWEVSAGAALLEAIERALGPLPFVAENLGVITPAVEALRRRFRLPGMAVLQFAFGDDPQAASFRPHNYAADTVAYSGTHDNDTAMGWWHGGAGQSVRSEHDVAREKAFAKAYLDTDGTEMNWVMIRALLASVADTAIVPLQDVLGLGSEARMNVPATVGRNWRWRFRDGQLHAEHAGRLAELVRLYEREAA
jgi:4-alpha-glucanotransferase